MLEHINGTRLSLQENYNRTALSYYDYDDKEFHDEMNAISDEYTNIMNDAANEKIIIHDNGISIAQLEEIIERAKNYRESGENWYHTSLSLNAIIVENKTLYISSLSDETAFEGSQGFNQYQDLVNELEEVNYVKVYPNNTENNALDAVGGVYILHKYEID